jgi:Family of unknown function (DUF6477)
MMTDFATIVAALRRPRILIRAARAGVSDYRRERDLKRLLRLSRATAPRQALGTLLAEEDRLEATRTAGDATYNLQRHVAVLTAILAEARLLPSGPATA